MEDLSAAWDKIAFLLVHVTNYELQWVLWTTVVASWHLSTVLGRHDARLREAKLARGVAAFYACLSLAFWMAHVILT